MVAGANALAARRRGWYIPCGDAKGAAVAHGEHVRWHVVNVVLRVALMDVLSVLLTAMLRGRE